VYDGSRGGLGIMARRCRAVGLIWFLHRLITGISLVFSWDRNADLNLILLGLMVQEQFAPEPLVLIALANPIQTFRTGAMLLFDPQLVLLGPTAYVILDLFGQTGFLIWSFAYPLVLGTVCAVTGYVVFRRGDLL